MLDLQKQRWAVFLGKNRGWLVGGIVIVAAPVALFLHLIEFFYHSSLGVLSGVVDFLIEILLASALAVALVRSLRDRWALIRCAVTTRNANLQLRREIQKLARTEAELVRRTRELGESNERFRIASEQSGQIVYDWAPQTGERSWCGAMEIMLGYPPDEFKRLGEENLESLIHPDDRSVVMPEIRRTSLQPGPFALAYRLRRRDATYASIINRGISLPDESGRVRRTVGTLADMTEVEKMEDDVRRNSRLTATLFDLIPGPVFYIGTDGRYRHCNRALAQLFGRPLDEIVGKTISELASTIPPELGARYEARNRELLAKGGTQSHSLPVRCADGVERDYFASKCVLYGEGGQAEGILGVMLDISERREMEQALADNERLLGRAMDLARVAHWTQDVINDLFLVNDRFYAMLGTSAEREGGYVLPKEVFFREFLFPEESDSLRGMAARTAARPDRRDIAEFQHRLRRRDGQVIHVLVRMEIKREADGRVIQAIGTTQDITLRRKAEDDLNKLWAAVEQSPVAVVITDPAGRIEYVNQKFVEATGLHATESRGQIPPVLDPASHTPAVYQELRGAIRSGRPWRGELSRQKAGATFWDSVLVSPVRDATGDITHFISIQEDITLRRKVTVELAKAGNVLQQQAAFLRAVTGSTPNSFYVSDVRQDRVLYCNRRFSDTWGLTDIRDQLLGGEIKHSEVVQRLGAVVAAPDAFGRIWDQLRNLGPNAEVDADVALKDGRILHHLTVPVLNENNQFLGHLSVFQDVTKQKRATQRLSDSLSQKEILLREVYHRVKNNLQVISSLIKLQSVSINDEQTLNLIRETQDRVRSMALVHEKLYRADDLAKIDFAEYAQQLVAMLARSYRTEGRPVSLKFALQKTPLNLETSVPCGLILNELVSNALKYAFSHTAEHALPEIKVELSALETGEYLLLVGDNGIGLDPAIDIYHTESLGLQVVSMLTEQLSGTMAVERQAGTIFRITFREIKENRRDRFLGETAPSAGSENLPAGAI